MSRTPSLASCAVIACLAIAGAGAASSFAKTSTIRIDTTGYVPPPFPLAPTQDQFSQIVSGPTESTSNTVAEATYGVAPGGESFQTGSITRSAQEGPPAVGEPEVGPAARAAVAATGVNTGMNGIINIESAYSIPQGMYDPKSPVGEEAFWSIYVKYDGRLSASVFGTPLFFGEQASAYAQAALIMSWSGEGVFKPGHLDKVGFAYDSSPKDPSRETFEFPSEETEIKLHVRNGKPINLGFSLWVEAGVDAPWGTGGTATANFSDTFQFMGTKSVTDLNGNVLTGYHIMDDSGYDWGFPAAAVPEPTGAGLLLGASALAALRRRSRKSNGRE